MPPTPPNKSPAAPSVFAPAALLREARRQKNLPAVDVPAVCILDPDGDIVRRLRAEGRARPFDGWPCYHTRLDTFELAGRQAGIIGCAVGAPFAVLIAEELFATLAAQPDIRGPDRGGRQAALLRDHRPRAARRRHQLSLRGSCRLCARGSGAGRGGGQSA